MVAIELGGDVHVHDVARAEHDVRMRNAVTDHRVRAHADRRGEALVAELTRLAALGQRVFAHERIDLVRANARSKRAPDVSEGLGGCTAGSTHARDGARVVDHDRHGVSVFRRSAHIQYRIGIARERLIPGGARGTVKAP